METEKNSRPNEFRKLASDLLRTVAATMVVATITTTVRFSVGQETVVHKVRGVVTNDAGTKMEGACVSALQVTASGGAGNLPCQRTGRDGEFTLRLPPGKYVIRAKHEAEGYPDPSFLFSSDPRANFPEVVVERSDVTGVRVILAARGGVLEGTVLDGATRLPIAGAKITISDPHASGAYVEVFSTKSGHFQFTVPNKLVSVTATSPGYMASQSEELLLSSGQHQSIEFELNKRK